MTVIPALKPAPVLGGGLGSSAVPCALRQAQPPCHHSLWVVSIIRKHRQSAPTLGLAAEELGEGNNCPEWLSSSPAASWSAGVGTYTVSGRDALRLWDITPVGGKAQCWLKRGIKRSISVLGLWLWVGHPLCLGVSARSSEELGELNEGRLKHPYPVVHSHVVLPSTRALVPSGQDARASMLALGSSCCPSLVFGSQTCGSCPQDLPAAS